MCMKDLNVSTIFCESISNNDDKISFGNVCGHIKAILKESEGESFYEAKNLNVVSILSALSTEEDEDLEKKYDILWLFGSVDDEGKFDSHELAQGTFDTNQNKIGKIDGVSNKSYTNQMMGISLDGYKFKRIGKHYLKVYLREVCSSDGVWQLQTMNDINVIESEE